MRSPTSAESSSIAADGCAEHALAPFDGQVRPRQQLDVRAVRGQRRPQLVRGVRDQLLLSLLRLVERCEHRVEVGREARQLVPAAHRDPLVEVARRAHLAHRPGERTHRAQHRIRGQPSEQARRERPAERQAEQQPADAGDRRVRLGQRAQGPHQPVARRRQSHRVQPHRRAGEAHVPEVRAARALATALADRSRARRSADEESCPRPRRSRRRHGADARDDLEFSRPRARRTGGAGPCRRRSVSSTCHFAATASADWISETSIWSCSFERTST